MELFAYLHGIYPRSEALVRATRDHDRGRILDSELKEQYERDYARLIELQRGAGLRPLSDGLLNWQDVFRPLSEIVAGWEPGALVRYFDNNTFYRQPHITGPLQLDEGKLDGWLKRYVQTQRAEGEPWVATLPSPGFFAYASRDEHYGSKRALAQAYAEEVLGPLVHALAKKGVQWVQLQEPWLAFHRPDDGLDVLKGALSALALARRKSQGLKLALHLYFGDAAPLLNELLKLDLDIDAVGADFVATDLEALSPLRGRTLLLGCVDSRESWVETPEQILSFAKRALEALEPDGLALVPNADLELVPEAIAHKKAQALGEALQRLRAELQGRRSA